MENVSVSVTGTPIPEEEIEQYVARGRRLYGSALDGIELESDGEYVDIRYHTVSTPFERIRRITGYLVGTLDRFNNAKRAEESERIKHAIEM